jgi:HAD superfamily hydrolase (TIGR01509 family)
LSQNSKRRRLVFIFDIGGVVIIWRNNDPLFKAVAVRYGVPFSKLRAQMVSLLPAMESGKISARKYLQLSLRSVGKQMNPGDNATKILAEPFERISKSRLGVMAIIQQLKRRGYEVYAFSNTSPPHVPVMRMRGWTTPLFDQFFASCYIGDVKPNNSAFRKVLSKIGAKPSQVVFIDNTKKHVIGARRVGIRKSIQFQTVRSLRKSLRIILREYDSKYGSRHIK